MATFGSRTYGNEYIEVTQIGDHYKMYLNKRTGEVTDEVKLAKEWIDQQYFNREVKVLYQRLTANYRIPILLFSREDFEL